MTNASPVTNSMFATLNFITELTPLTTSMSTTELTPITRNLNINSESVGRNLQINFQSRP